MVSSWLTYTFTNRLTVAGSLNFLASNLLLVNAETRSVDLLLERRCLEVESRMCDLCLLSTIKIHTQCCVTNLSLSLLRLRERWYSSLDRCLLRWGGDSLLFLLFFWLDWGLGSEVTWPLVEVTWPLVEVTWPLVEITWPLVEVDGGVSLPNSVMNSIFPSGETERELLHVYNYNVN